MSTGNKILEKLVAITPKRMLKRPVDHRGYPVPWFVTHKDPEGQWDFRVVDPHRVEQAIKQKRCWICGHKLGVHVAFAVGPMCGVDLVSGEPPQHLACAEFAVKACPFMLYPQRGRNTKDLPQGATENPGAIKRNPGVTLIWETAKYEVIPNGPSFLFRMGPSTAVSFWTEGRPSTRDEIYASVNSGLPTLAKMANEQGREAEDALASMVRDFSELLPAT